MRYFWPPTLLGETHTHPAVRLHLHRSTADRGLLQQVRLAHALYLLGLFVSVVGVRSLLRWPLSPRNPQEHKKQRGVPRSAPRTSPLAVAVPLSMRMPLALIVHNLHW